MSRSVFFEPLIQPCRSWLRKRSRILPAELPAPFFHAKNINAAIEYFSTFDGRRDGDPELQERMHGKCYVCKEEVDFAVAPPEDGGRVNWRENLTCPKCGLINRWRSCLHVFEEVCKPVPNERIYLTESLSPVYQNLAKRYCRLISSEYLPRAEFGELTLRNGVAIRNEDITALRFTDASFDAVLCFDVLEHVADYRAALGEFYRVLGAGGQLLLSVPVSYQQKTLVRATLDDDGNVIHLVEPCYHGDPLSDQGVLSYYDFGMDLLDDMREAGFEECFALCFNSQEWGYAEDNVMFVARKLKSSVRKSTMAKLAWQGAVYRSRLLAQKFSEVFRYVVHLGQRFPRRASTKVPDDIMVEKHILHSPIRPDTGAVDVPAIFHYWSNKHIKPDMSRFGFSNVEDFVFNHAKSLVKASSNRPVNILSITTGCCDLEIKIAGKLLQLQLDNFYIECLGSDSRTMKSAREVVCSAGLSKFFRFTNVNPDHWKPYRKYGVIIANQSLHDVRKLEALLDSVGYCLQADGKFIVADTIGRNANMYWPEAMHALRPFWDELPAGYRYNRVLRRREEQFINHDGTREGFGAIRSQDILALLLERFNFKFFFPYGNIIFVFISQSFGHNFNADADWDRDFIDRVHARDEAGMLSGELKPCSMLAVLTRQETELVLRHPVLTPGHCIRKVAGDHDHASESRRMGR